jgi:DNA repair and recombination RAD54-like protein
VGGTRSSDSSKRSRVVFTENDFYTNTEVDEPATKKSKKGKKKGDDDDSDDDGKKKGKGGFVDRYVAPPPPKQFPVYRPKSIDSVSKPFSIPGIKKKGIILDVKASQRVLGTRQPGEIIPAPLHNPLADQAIVLWDPTVDDREAELEQERLKAEKAAEEAAEAKGATKLDLERKKVHRSLADILGLADRAKQKSMVKKVAVVIDPVLGQKLRPHQVAGVKFLYRCSVGMTDDNAFGCVDFPPFRPSVLFAY